MLREEMISGTKVRTPNGFSARIYGTPPTDSAKFFVWIDGVGIDGPYLPEELKPPGCCCTPIMECVQCKIHGDPAPHDHQGICEGHQEKSTSA